MGQLVWDVSQYFLLSFAFGIYFFTPVASTQLTGVGLLKVMLSVVGGMLFLSLGIHLAETQSFLSLSAYIYYISLVLIVITYFTHQNEKSPLMWFFYVIQTLGLGLLGYLFMKSNYENWAYFILSGLFSGIITYAMILGHWYLVTPKLSERPLVVSMLWLWPLLALKVGLSAYEYFGHPDYFTSGTSLGGGYMFNWIMLSMRGLWGYFVIGVLSVFSWKLIRMRSIQSATGVLYVMVFFLLVGELISGYLFYNFGLKI